MSKMIARIDDPEAQDAQIALYAAEERRVYETFIHSVMALRDEPDPAQRKRLAREVKANFKHYLKINQDMSVLLGGMNEVNDYLRAQLRDALSAVQKVKDLGYEEAKAVLVEIVVANLEDFLRMDKESAHRFAKLIVYGEVEGIPDLRAIGDCIERELAVAYGR